MNELKPTDILSLLIFGSAVAIAAYRIIKSIKKQKNTNSCEDQCESNCNACEVFKLKEELKKQQDKKEKDTK